MLQIVTNVSDCVQPLSVNAIVEDGAVAEKKPDRRDKRRLESLRAQLRDLQRRLAGARKQPDDPREIQQLEQEVKAIQSEIDRITGAESG